MRPPKSVGVNLYVGAQIKCLSEDLIKNFTEGDRLVIIGDD